MKGVCLSPRLAFLLLGLLLIAAAAHAGPVVYLDSYGKATTVDNPAATDALSALNALAGGAPRMFAAMGLSSAVPRGTKVLDFAIEGNVCIVNFSKKIAVGLDEAKIEAIFNQVKWTLWQYGIEIDIRILVEGEPIADFLAPTPFIEPKQDAKLLQANGLVGASSLSGHTITLSPGHGIYWNGSGWYHARPVYCSPLSNEDLHNVDNAIYLTAFLEADGMLVKKVRCQDKSYGNYGAYEWWRMGATYWLWNVGYPCTVYGSYSGCSLGDGATETNDDIRARPLASDYDNTEIYISLHTNGLNGDCYGASCPSGTDTYYDCGTEHKKFCTVSLNLANAVHDNLISALRNEVGDSAWRDNGKHDSNGAYGEIRIPDRAAILVELAYHDTCENDAVKLRDHFWTSGAMWGVYRGICAYFGQTPTWGFYSDEYVSDTIPAQMAPGETRQVTVTFRNRGVVWSEAKAFRLGAVGDSDPFTATNRQTISGEVAPGATYTWTFTLTAPTVEGSYVTDWQMVRDGVQWFGATLTKSIQVGGAGDTEAPTVPTNLTASVVSTTQIDLAWTASTDNSGVIAGYKIFRDGAYLNTTAGVTFSDTTCAPNTTYTYTVSAFDGALNESAQSAPASATTPAVTDYIIDNTGATFTGTWSAGTSAVDKYGADYRYIGTSSSETGTATWRPDIGAAGNYDVFCWYPQGTNRTTAAPYIIYWNGGSQQVNVNQQSGGGRWNLLAAAKPFAAGTAGYLKIGNATGEASLVVMADAARFTKVAADTTAPVISNVASTTGNTTATVTWTTDEPATSQVEYGLTTSYGSLTVLDTNMVTSHTVNITGLVRRTTYNYRVRSKDAAQNEAISGNYTFRTK